MRSLMPVLALGLLLAFSPSYAGSAAADPGIASLRIGAFDTRGMTGDKAIEKLSATLTSLSFAGEYKIRVVTEPEKEPDFKPQTFPKIARKELRLDRPVSLAVTGFPVLSVAQALAAQIDGAASLRGKEILIYPARGTFEPLVTDTFQVPPRAGGNTDIQDQLAAQGIEFYEGSYARLTAKTGQLVVRTTQEQIDLVHSLVD